ncbi:MAG: hypothetical protein EPN94_12100 [Nitrospirae bacterium]|nr:MAG: hypothetical protein EPN94_12100 [Nitrospirota bacterium]
MPIAKHLQDEGNKIIVGIVESVNDLKIEEEKDNEKQEDKKQRLSNHDGIIKKYTLSNVMDLLKSVKDSDKQNYFFFFDFNVLYKISEDILKMGFKKGLFPTKAYYDLEKERDLAKRFIKKYYPRIKVAEYFSFNKIEDGLRKLQQSNDIYVLKSNGDFGETFVPRTDDLIIAKKQISYCLNKFKNEYEKGGFILEKKIQNCIEITPVLLFYDGVPLYSILEFENKHYGSGNIGSQKGGNQVISVQTDIDCEINKIAFPEIVYKLAKQQIGLSIYDSGLLYDGRNFWFTEFCAMRYGWDGIFSEMVMTGDNKPFVGEYFESIMNKKNPIKNKYGSAIRLFNYEGDREDTLSPKDGGILTWEKSIENNLFLYNVRKQEDHIVDTADKDFVATITASGDSLEETVRKLYKRVDKFNFEKLYYRPVFDFLSKDYKTSIPNRIEAISEFL